MSESTHKMGVKLVDETAGAFASIQGRAAAASARIRSMLGGAISLAGSYLGLRAIGGAVNQLSHLSDVAMVTGTSVDFLTRASTAFQVAGLPMSIESLARSMMFMQKNTGKQGADAFFDIAKQIASIPDASKRAQAAIQTFGRSGIELLPLVNNGAEAIDKFQKLQSIMPGVSNAAANAGDDVGDALTTLGRGAQAIMLKAVGKICELWGKEFPGGVRAGALNAQNWLETFFKKAYAYIKKYSAYLGAVGGLVADFFSEGPAQAWDVFTGTIDEATKDFDRSIAAAEEQREKYVATLKEFKPDELANALGANRRNMTEAGESFGAAAAKRISNALIMGGSNQANKIAILGPQYQNESKKQTSLLEKIAQNTEKTAENTDGGTDEIPATNLGV